MKVCSKLFLVFALGQSLAYGASFMDLFEAEQKKTKEVLASENWDEFKNVHVVFVQGVMNELARIPNYYFYDNISELKRLKISYSNLRYSTRKTVPENAEKLYEDIKKISAESKKSIVLIGHSKGAANSLYCLLKHSHLLTEKIVDKAVLINAAIGGSDLVPNIRRDPLSQLIGKIMGRGLKTLDPKEAQKNFTEAFNEFKHTLDKNKKNEFANFSDRIFYLRTAIKSKPGAGVRVVQFFSSKNKLQGEHDGVLNLDQQMLKADLKFGVDIENSLDADHTELVVAGSLSRANRKLRRAFTRALLRKISQPICEKL